MLEHIFNLFTSFFAIGAVSFGGGYAMVQPMLDAVSRFQWMDIETFNAGVGIANMSPGPFAVNVATFVGMKVAGPAGALAATLGVLFPSVVIVTTIARFFYGFNEKPVVQGVLSGVRPVIIGLIASAVYSIARIPFTNTLPTRIGVSGNYVAMVIAVGMIIAIRRFKLHPITSILVSAVIGMLIY